MGWWDDATGFVEDAAGAIADVAEGVAETAYDYGSGAVESVGASAWDAALGTISIVNDITPDVPWVDVNVKDGQLGVGVDVYGVGASMSVGEHGVTAAVDGGYLGGAQVGVTDEGWNVGLQLGDTDWPSYLPALSFGAKGDYDGNVDAQFEAQGAIPIPGPNGMLVMEAGGEFNRNEDGTWGVAGHGQADYYGLDGTKAGVGAHASYAETADGSVTTAGGSGYIETAGGFSASANVDYTRLQKGDDILESLDAAAQFKGYGFEGGGRLEYDRALIDGNEVTSLDAAGKVKGHGLEASGTASYDELTTADGKTESNWDTDYSVKGLDDLVGDSAIGTYADKAGIDLPTLDHTSAQPASEIEAKVDEFVAHDSTSYAEIAAATADTPEELATAPETFAEPAPEPAPAEELEASLEGLDNF